MRIRRYGMTRSSSRSSYKTWCTRRSDNEVAFDFCGVVVLLFDRQLGERVLPPRWWMWLRLCADLLQCSSVVLRSRAFVLCSGPDVCGSRTGLCPGSGCGRSQLLRSGCCS